MLTKKTPKALNLYWDFTEYMKLQYHLNTTFFLGAVYVRYTQILQLQLNKAQGYSLISEEQFLSRSGPSVCLSDMLEIQH